MKKISIQLPVTEYDSLEELRPEDRELILAAREAAENAYAPYSNYYVGSALRLENGVIFRGNNQENVAFPSGLCAERVALFAAAAAYPEVPVETIAIVARSSGQAADSPVTPCGACRQVMAEYQNRHQHNIRILLAGATGKTVEIEEVGHLLPLMFHANHLKKSGG